MRGVLFTGNRQVEITEFPDPMPGPGEVVVEIKASGMCGSDLKFYRAAPGEAQAALGLGDLSEPIIAGHEPCGVVAEVGPGVTEREARVGQRVMDHHYCGCGVCHHCRIGWSQLCGEGFVVYGVTAHGAHADYIKVPARTLVELPDSLSFETGAAISCGTGTAYGALRRMNLSGRDTLAVFGQGPVGLAANQLGAAMGARVIALDPSPERRALAPAFGADAVIDPAADDPVEALKELTGGAGVDLALDCSGAEAARSSAVKATRTWGTVCFVGEGGSVTLDVSPDLIRKQLTVIGSWTFSSVIQEECARFVADRKVDVDKLFTQRYT
ncbi:MAG: zinc-binding dehydrogenase, partial [Minwuiales bacterium]|nr:zinc-binding dehydrogenase [Minwuiales bacterium]